MDVQYQGKTLWPFDFKNDFPREALKIPLLEAFENRPDDVLEIILQGVQCTLVQGVNESSHKTHKNKQTNKK